MPINLDLMTLVNNLQVGLVVHLPNTEIVFSNPKARELLGLTEDQLVGKTSLDPSWNVVHEDGTAFPGAEFPSCRAIETGLPVLDVFMGVYRPIIGDRVSLLVNAYPQFSTEGALECVVVSTIDLSERQRALAAKIRAEEWLKIAIASSNVGLWDWNVRTREVTYSGELNRILGFGDVETTHSYDAARDLVHPDDVDAMLREFESHIANNEFEFQTKFRARHRDGSWIWVYVRAGVICDATGAPLSILGCSVVITELKQVEETLRMAQAGSESLSRQLIRTRESECGRLAREIHDELGQLLVAMKMNIRRIQATAEKEVSAKLEENVSMIGQCISQVRDIALNLRPPHLDAIGLAAALHWYVKKQVQAFSVSIDLRVIPAEISVPQEVAIVCFRIVQEAVTNSIKHSGSQGIVVETRQQSGELTLSISDDGRGFDVDRALKNASQGDTFGLSGMLERVALANGKIDIRSKIGHGTTIEVWFRL